MSGAVVFGLCALSFAAGCVLTAVMLRRDRTPEPVTDARVPTMNLRLPPEDYATRPIHRNPVMGIPTALPPPEPARPTLVLVPDLEPEEPVRQDEVRRMHVVRDAVESDEPVVHGSQPVSDQVPDRTEPVLVEVPTGPEPEPGTSAPVTDQPAPQVHLPDTGEYRRRC
ncbi:hypothetical protein [Saccharothrix deserti]|uniref:hypothetical protein n=1 Tax=Saccharothrix deserti TaxID=2593674 RepID=UPI00131DF6EB|nr:hypothetical protein [Saccharothrix deserti]